MAAGLLLLTIAMTGMSLAATRSVLHPAVVFPSIWVFQLLGLLIFQERFIEVNLETNLILMAGCLAFIVGTLPIFNSPSPISGSFRVVAPNGLRFYVVGVLVLVCLVGQVSIFSSLANGEDLAVGLVYARTLISIDGEDIYGLYKYGNPLALGALIALQILSYRGRATAKHRVLLGFFFAASLIMSVLSTGRGPILFVFLLLALTHLLAGDQRELSSRLVKVIGVLASLMFIIFWIMGGAMGKAGEEALVALSDLVDYLFSSIPALSAYIDENSISLLGNEYGANTFRLVFAVMAAVGFAEPPASLVQEFIAVPHLTNLYTFYLHYLQDFGWVGVILLPLLLGMFHGMLYRTAMYGRESDYLMYLLVVSYLPLLQMVFQETHFSTLASWIQLALIGWFLSESRGRAVGVKK